MRMLDIQKKEYEEDTKYKAKGFQALSSSQLRDADESDAGSERSHDDDFHPSDVESIEGDQQQHQQQLYLDLDLVRAHSSTSSLCSNVSCYEQVSVTVRL